MTAMVDEGPSYTNSKCAKDGGGVDNNSPSKTGSLCAS